MKQTLKHILQTISYVNPNRTLWFLLFVLSFMSLFDILRIKLEYFSWLSVAGVIVLVFFKATLLTWAYALLKRNSVTKVIIIILIVLYALFSVTNFIGTLFYSRGISRTFYIILLETNPIEVNEFATGLLHNLKFGILSTITWGCILALVAVYLLFRYMPEHILKTLGATGTVAGILCTIYICITGGKIDMYYMLIRVPYYAAVAFQDHKTTTDCHRYIKPLPSPETAQTTAAATDILLVIGESSSRLHHSQYGYPITTNRFTQSFSNSIYSFTDAIGSSANTSDNMPRILTFMRDDELEEWYKYPSIFQLYKHLGYRTYWFSNQERTGSYSNTSTSIACVADESVYVNKINSEDDMIQNLDEALLPHTLKALSDTAHRRLIALHLLGSHVTYAQRTPDSRKPITVNDELRHSPGKWFTREKARVRADYDNSVLYTDSLLSVILTTLSKSNRPSMLIYLSDHGDNVYDNSDFQGRDGKNVMVPFWVYLNPAYENANPKKAQLLRKVTNRRFTTANTIHMLITLTGSKYRLYDPQLDVMNASYDSLRTRYVDEHPWHPDLKTPSHKK